MLVGERGVEGSLLGVGASERGRRSCRWSSCWHRTRNPKQRRSLKESRNEVIRLRESGEQVGLPRLVSHPSSTMTQSPGEPRKKKSKTDKLSNTTTPVSDSVPLPSPAAQKKRKLAEDEEPVTDNGEDAAESGADAEDGAAAAKELTKAEKGKAKKRRKEEQRALVSALGPPAEPQPSRAIADSRLNLQENPPSFSFDTRGFKGGRMIQVKVSSAQRHLLCTLVAG